MRRDPYDLVNRRARVRVNTTAIGHQHQVMAEGRVLAYSVHPQILVEADDGTRSWWSTDLTVTDLTPPAALDRFRHAHVCVSCSDGARPGPGCHNCRNTGMDQTPCQTEGHEAQCPHGCCEEIVSGWREQR